MKSARMGQFFLAGLTVVAMGSVARADASAEKEAEEYMQTWEDRGREACKDNERGCAAAGHALDRAAAAYEKAGKLDKAIMIRRMILDPQWHLDYTDYGRAAAFTLAKNLQSITEYAEAAEMIETAVRRFAKTDEAPDALIDALLLRVGTGETDRALADLQLFAKNYGALRAADVPKLAVAIGSDLWDKGRAKDVPPFFATWMPTVERQGNLLHRAQAHAMLGRAHAHLGSKAAATTEFDTVRALWARPDETVRQVQALGGSQAEQLRRIGQTITVVGEALFFFAEQKRATAEALRFPEYTGSGDKDSVLTFVNTKVSEWLKNKRTAIEEAESEYQKILALQPLPPPRWAIAAAGRVGFLWSSFVADFRRAPMPKEWNSSAPLPGTSIPGTQIKKLYLEQLSAMSEPFLERSKQAFQVCANQATRFQWFDDHSQACVRWLEKNDRKRWIPFDELKPQPIHIGQPIKTMPILPP